jgi:hypothetical protein
MKRTLLLILAASPAAAQVPLRGLAYDSLHGRPLSGAFIGIVGMSVSAVSDSAGRFVLPSVPKGTHRVVMQHDVLDAIGLSAAGARAVVNGEKDSVIVAVPSFATLWRAACGREAPSVSDSGFVFGTVQRGNQPVPLSVVTVSWLDLSMDSTKAVRQKQKVMEVDADSSGNFALCGVPTTTGLSLRANIGTSFGVWTDIAPLDRERIARRDLSIIAISPTQFALPQTVAFTGRVRRDSTDAPLPEADVLIADLGLSGSTNERGEFRITGIPAGTHTVQVRKIGYAFSEQRIDFGTESIDRTLIMSRITTLDSVRVTSRYSPNDEAMRLFEENRKLGLGKFFTREDLEKSRERPMVDILSQLPGTKPLSVQGGLGYILSSRGTRSLSNDCAPQMQDHPAADTATRRKVRAGQPPPPPCLTGCFPHVFLDGADVSPTEVPNINRFTPDQLEAIEVYAGGAQVPPEYNRLNKSYCGVIVLHTRRGKSP